MLSHKGYIHVILFFAISENSSVEVPQVSHKLHVREESSGFVSTLVKLITLSLTAYIHFGITSHNLVRLLRISGQLFVLLLLH